jgi:hypothetical protein
MSGGGWGTVVAGGILTGLVMAWGAGAFADDSPAPARESAGVHSSSPARESVGVPSSVPNAEEMCRDIESRLDVTCNVEATDDEGGWGA